MRRISVDVDCPGCNLSGAAILYYNPDEQTYESTKQSKCLECGSSKITCKISQTPTYTATMPRKLERTRICRNCGNSHKDSRIVLPNEWEDLTNELPYCPRCKGPFDSEFTELATVYPSKS